MIDGVTVLASEIVTTSCAGMNIIGYIFIEMLALGFILLLAGMVADSLGLVQTGAIMLASSFILFLIGIPIDAMTQIPDYTKYEVIIDDSVSMSEFMDTYEVLEQRGQIYVIKEIEE